MDQLHHKLPQLIYSCSSLTTLLEFCGHETFRLPQIYDSDLDITTSYQILGVRKDVTEFICKMDFYVIYVIFIFHSSERAKLIWESHYYWVAKHFCMEKKIVVLSKYLYWSKLHSKVSRYLRSCTTCLTAKPTITKQRLHTMVPTLDTP